MSQVLTPDPQDDKKPEGSLFSGTQTSNAPTRLNLRRLETIQRWLQYGAAAALLITVGLFVFASYKLKGLYDEIEEQKKTIANNNAIIESQKDKIIKKDETIRDVSSTQYKPSQDKVILVGGEFNPRIYIQIGEESQRRRANEVAVQLKTRGYLVPGIENISGKAQAPPVSQLRYFQAGEGAQKDIDDIATYFKGIDVKLKVVQLPPTRGVRTRTYEIWFGEEF